MARRQRRNGSGARRVGIDRVGIVRTLGLIGALGAFGGLAGPALAGDGVLEINQTCATSGGCFSTDSAGFPVTLGAGRYRLTSDLVVGSENESAIRATTSDVEIDLAGFTISGPVVCTGTSGATLACTPTSGTGSGVERSTTSVIGISVRNGTIRGMGFRAVSLGEYSVVSRVHASSNRGLGIVVGSSSIVRDCVLTRNGSTALSAGDGSLVVRTTSSLNGGTGLATGDGSNVRENAAYDNGGDGLQTGIGSLLVSNLSAQNEGDGIQSIGRASFQRNSLRANVGFGLNTVSSLLPSAHRYNTFLGNVLGATSNGVSLGANDCDGVAC